MAYAFIAYSRKDRLLALRLWDELRWRGLDVGIDLQDVPAHFDRRAVLEDMVTECEVLLLLVSPYADGDDELRRMHLLAIEQERDVIALLLPGGELPPILKCAKTLMLGNYERGLKHLMRLIPPEQLQTAADPRRVLENLRHQSPDVRRTTLYVVAKEKLTRAVPRTITLMLTDIDEEVRAAAAWALDQMNNVDAAPSLILALYDDCFSVRSNAGWGLVSMGRRKDAPASRAIIPAVIDILRDESNPHGTREMAYMVLLRIGGKQAYDAIDRYWKA
jgi:HEAT repeat protein